LLRISDAAALAAVATTGGASAAIDLKTRRVPNFITFGTAAAGVALAAMHLTAQTVPTALAGFALGLVLMLPAHVVGAMGAGDVKLFAAVGSLLGPRDILVAFVYTALFGGLLAIVVALQRRRLGTTLERTASLLSTGGGNVSEIEHPGANNRFAYAPAIALGALAAALGL
jgi:prepilin peptidase CpaA